MIIPHQDVFGGAKVIEWDVNLRQTWQAHCGLENADDLTRDAVDEDMFSERIRGSSETATPSAVGNQGDLSTLGDVVSLVEIATELWRNAEDGEKVRADAGPPDTFGSGSSST